MLVNTPVRYVATTMAAVNSREAEAAAGSKPSAAGMCRREMRAHRAAPPAAGSQRSAGMHGCHPGSTRPTVLERTERFFEARVRRATGRAATGCRMRERRSKEARRQARADSSRATDRRVRSSSRRVRVPVQVRCSRRDHAVTQRGPTTLGECPDRDPGMRRRQRRFRDEVRVEHRARPARRGADTRRASGRMRLPPADSPADGDRRNHELVDVIASTIRIAGVLDRGGYG